MKMGSARYGQYPSLTEGTVTATWSHTLAYISTYGVRMCKDEQCIKSFQPPGNTGERIIPGIEIITQPGVPAVYHAR